MGLLLADTVLADTALLLLTALYLIYWYGTSTFDYWKKKGVPELETKVPFFGAALDSMLFRKQMSLHSQEMYNELDGNKYGGFFSMRKPTLMVRDPELLKQIMVKDFSSFTDNFIQVNAKNDPMFAYNIFSMRGEQWKYARSKLAPAFATGKIRNVFPLILEICNDLKNHLQRKIDSDNCEFEAHGLSKDYTTDVVGSCAFGIHCNSLTNSDNDFRKMGKEIMSPSTLRRQIELTIAFSFPSLASALGMKFVAQFVEDFFRDLILKAFAYREKHPEFKRNDFINLLMQLKKLGEVEQDEHDKKEINGMLEKNLSDKGKIDFNDTVLTAQAVGFFIDGFETSSLALAFTLHELAMNQDIQTKLREELQKCFESSDGKIDYDNIRGCTYLENVMHETLRIYSPAGMLTRMCTKRYKIPDSDVHLDVGDVVTIPVYALHHDPKYFPDPEVFDPDRFTEEAKKTRPAFSYLPFGEGPRQCIGFRFAQAQVKAALATIVLNFKVEQSEKTIHPVVFDEKNFLLHAKNGLHLKISPL
ncbi:cytochrome P450 9e2-like [Neocloeon triangulifer]|uniref:cytochrome P450 9e2-like n=1 Tax=Neocloeon triangulifer TaxID=2078957 RepID=UPI00286EE70B|nr:cytochrome P450 9e2-like [Neocloeon triangulifer]XP_059477146.1 cytochrome P450 9e2-like [Neocloeon triangulifer]XP_059477147.1 cytochrome P450 9e2-like [Neocloeon triangulifer]XP_059477148.1 cytochrome P450 9e2-like [Neocloeon triangulifer]